MVKSLGVGFVGTGFISDMYAHCCKANPHARIVSVASITGSHIEEFARRHGIETWYTDYTKMFKRKDIDVVCIGTPNSTHASIAISAAEHGKHVICTKPLATTMGQADDMINTCNRFNVKLMYAENLLFAPAVRRAQEIIHEGALGKLLAIEAREQHSGTHSKYTSRKDYCGGGVLISMAVHPIASAMRFINAPVKRVYAEVGNMRQIYEAEDYVVLILRFENEVSAVIHSNYITKGGMQDRTEIYGTEGMLFIDLTHANTLRVYSEVGYPYVIEKASMSKGWTLPALDERWQYGFIDMINHFIHCVIEDEKPRSTGIFGRDVLKIVFAGYESAERSLPIMIYE